MTLIDFIVNHAERGECTCGKCIDGKASPQQPTGHTADLVFFKVRAANDANTETLRKLVREHKGEYCDVDLFDGNEHGYMEIGGWVGDQGMALMLMGLGSLLGLWRLLTPKTVLGASAPDDLVQQMAGMGMVTVRASNGDTP